ncbi:MAG: sulfatase [Myxococcota bacterium]
MPGSKAEGNERRSLRDSVGTGGFMALSWLASAWLILAAADLLLQASLDGSVLATRDLPAGLRWELVAWELELLALGVFTVGGLLILLRAWGSRLLAPKKARAAGWILTLAVAILVGLYAGSWASFVNSGQFLDASVLGFMAENPVQFFQHAAHIDPALTLGVPLLLVLMTLALCGGIPRALSRVGPGMRLGVVSIAVGVLAVCLVLSPGEPDIARAVSSHAPDFWPDRGVSDPDAGLVYTEGDLLVAARNERSGPVSHLWAEWSGWSDRTGQELLLDDSIVTRRRPILSMEAWLETLEGSEVEPWNVVVVVVESLRSDQLRAFGGTRDVMPNVDAIAADSLVYPDHYTQASHSNYADLALLSSHYPLRSPRTHLYPENPTYPRVLIYDVLKRLGWHTAVISSQNENWGRMINYLRTGSIDHFFHSENFDGPTYVPRDDTGFEKFIKGGKRSGKIDDRFTIDEAMRWIGSIPEEDPFFIYLNLQNSHLPYETPADFPRRFGPDSISFTIRFGGYPRSETQTVKDIYADSLAYVDYQIGRLIEYLKQEVRWEDTLLVVTGDTGQAFYEHGFVAHANMIFNEVMQVPLVLHVPGGEARVDQRPAQHIDIPPTILDLLGIPPHPAFQGVSLIEEDPDYGRARYIMAQAPLAHQYAIIQGRFKLLHDLKRDLTMLIDLRVDAAERDNVAAEYPAMTAVLRRRLDTWRKHQLNYYDDVREHSVNYPPVLAD